MRKGALKQELSQLIHQYAAQGRLPSGMLKEVAVETIVDEVTEISAHLKEFGVNQKEIFSVILSADVKTACKKENGDWEIPW